MSIWGKILGGAAGFALGGPLGALIGAGIGHAVDRYRASQDPEPTDGDATRSIGFTIGVIVLGAKMAKADGKVTRDEIRAFKQVFRVEQEEEANVARLFDRARRDAHGFEPYAAQIQRLLQHSPQQLEALLDCLFHIAKADGKVDDAELRFLRSVAHIFGFDENEFARIREGHLGADESDPYHILGVARGASDDEVRAAHRRLLREHHPDKLMGSGLPPEVVEMATQKMATINAAYDRIRRDRDRRTA